MRDPQPLDLFAIAESATRHDLPLQFRAKGNEQLAALDGARPSPVDHFFVFGSNEQCAHHMQWVLEGVRNSVQPQDDAWKRGVEALQSLIVTYLCGAGIPVIVRAHTRTVRQELLQSIVGGRSVMSVQAPRSTKLPWHEPTDFGFTTSPLSITPANIWPRQSRGGGQHPIMTMGAYDVRYQERVISNTERRIMSLCSTDDLPSHNERSSELPGLLGTSRQPVFGQWDAPHTWSRTSEGSGPHLGETCQAPSIQVWRLRKVRSPDGYAVFADKLFIVLEVATMEPLWLELQADEFRWGRAFKETQLGKLVSTALLRAKTT